MGIPQLKQEVYLARTNMNTISLWFLWFLWSLLIKFYTMAPLNTIYGHYLYYGFFEYNITSCSKITLR